MTGDADATTDGSPTDGRPVRIPLENHEFEGDNNAYLLTDGDEAALVDTGVATGDTRESLRAGLASHGVAFADLDALVITHWHADHAGLAGEIQRESGATVYAHPADAPLIRWDDAAVADLRRVSRECYGEWGMPDPARERLEAFQERSGDAFGGGADVTPVADGEKLTLAGTTLEVVHAPGHTAGLIALAVDAPGSDDGRWILTGDAVLPVYTPNVGGADVRVDRPLERYVETLERIAGADYDRALPGHREAIEDPTARAREILAHHEERARRVLAVLDREGPADAWTVSADLFGDLEGIHVLHGPGEAFAHLDHLARAGHVRRNRSGASTTYRPDGDPPEGPIL